MATDFAVFLRRFLAAHVVRLPGCSPNTITSYRDTFKLLIAFFRDEASIPPERLTLARTDAAAITRFLNRLEVSRHNILGSGQTTSPAPLRVVELVDGDTHRPDI